MHFFEQWVSSRLAALEGKFDYLNPQEDNQTPVLPQKNRKVPRLLPGKGKVDTAIDTDCESVTDPSESSH